MKTYGDATTCYTRESAPAILHWVQPNSRVLEFGPAYGYMTRYMQQVLHCRVTCVELNPEMQPILAQYAEQVVVANLDSDPWEEQLVGKFDYIIFADVLEHLRDPLRTMQRSVRFGDCVLTSIPNIGHAAILLSLLSGRFDYRNLGLLDSTHVHFFTRKSMDELMHTCALQSTAECSKIKAYPFSTEFSISYGQHLLAAWSIARKVDSGVYQFCNKWERVPQGSIWVASRPHRYSFLQAWRVILFDALRYFMLKAHLRSDFVSRVWLKIR